MGKNVKKIQREFDSEKSTESSLRNVKYGFNREK